MLPFAAMYSIKHYLSFRFCAEKLLSRLEADYPEVNVDFFKKTRD